MTTPVIAFVGMTHLGLVSGIAAAEKGFTVICCDDSPERIASLRLGKLPVEEPQLNEILKSNASRLSFTDNFADIRECDLVYLAPDVATDDQGRSDLSLVDTLFERVVSVASSEAVIVILSQVPPGFTRSKQRPSLKLFYQVETLIFGRAVERALRPERYILGCEDPKKPLPRVLHEFLASHSCPILPMRYESAELAKISINMCLVASVTTANTLAEICEKIGADWSEIVPSLKLDQRIGPYAYLAPGLGISGGNLERDLATVCSLAARHGTDAGVVRAWIANSSYRRGWTLKLLHREVLSRVENPVVAILGLAYKAGTHSIKNSPALALTSDLIHYRLRIYDPIVPYTVIPNAKKYGAIDALDACDGADVLVIMTPWSQFRAIDPKKISQALKGKVVLDPFAVLDRTECETVKLRYYTLGVGA